MASFLWMGFKCLKATQSLLGVYFLPLSSHKFLVLIKSIWEGWKVEMTLKSASSFKLVFQPSYSQI